MIYQHKISTKVEEAFSELVNISLRNRRHLNKL